MSILNTVMATFPTKLAEAFSAKALEIYYATSVSEEITNQDYEGEIRDKSSILNILTFSKILSHTYTGADMTADDLTENSGQLKTDQAVDFYFRVKSYDKFRSYIKNPEGTILAQTANELKKVIDTYVLGFYTEVQAGNRIGTDYTTGTVSVDASGNVVGAGGATFTSGMVGKGFQATGQTAWYRITAFTDATHITIQDDLKDENAGSYSGGVVAGGTAFTIQANTSIQMTSSNIFDLLQQLQVKLDNQEIPAEDRWLVITPDVKRLITENSNFNPSGVPEAYQKLSIGMLPNGYLGGTMAGFKVYQSPRVAGDSVNGWHIMGGHKSAITFAMGFVETGMEDAIKNFGKLYKSLNVYGAKVVDERRKALVELFGRL